MDNMLTLLIFSPLFFSIIILFGQFSQKTSLFLGGLSTFISLILASFFMYHIDIGHAEIFDIVMPWWLDGISYALKIDHISAAFIALTAFIFPLCIISIYHVKALSKMIATLLALQTTIFGVFCAHDLVLFYLFFEASLIPMYLMIGIWGGAGRIQASFKFFLYTLAGSLLMLVAIVFIYNKVGSTSFDNIMAYDMALDIQKWLWIAFFVAFAVKIPMFPFHTWLPMAHVEAPTAGSVILASILLKLGGYGFLKLLIPFFPEASLYYADFVSILSVIAIIYASIVAFAQSDVKRLIAYSSIAHMGYVTLAIFTFTDVGLQASIYQMISHGFVSAGLFFAIGVVYDRYHTRDMAFYGGLAKVMPHFALIFMILTMANVGLPGTSGFVGEFLTIISVMSVNVFYASIICIAVILSAGYGLWLYRKMMLGTTDSKFDNAIDLTLREKIIFIPLIFTIIYFGLYTSDITYFVSPAVNQLLAHLYS